MSDPMAKLVLIALADRAGDDGTCYPSLQTVSEDCGTSISTVQRKLKLLEAMGLLTKVNRSKDGMKTSNLYRLPNTPKGYNVANTDRSERPIDRSQRPEGMVTVTNKTPIETPKNHTVRFTPPTLEELTAYMEEKELYYFDPKDFINYYESIGWKVGKNKMSKWKAAAANWNNKGKKKENTGGNRGRI
jgi:DNA-binding transcriptional MocR family regulator